MGNRLLIAVLLGLAALSGVAAYIGWNLAPDAQMSVHGYIAMVMGIGFSLVVGVGLMTLVFYSSRMGFDEEANHNAARSDDKGERVT